MCGGKEFHKILPEYVKLPLNRLIRGLGIKSFELRVFVLVNKLYSFRGVECDSILNIKEALLHFKRSDKGKIEINSWSSAVIFDFNKHIFSARFWIRLIGFNELYEINKQYVT